MPRRLMIILAIFLLIPVLCFAGPKVCVEKSTGKVVSFGYEDMSRFDLTEYEIHDVEIDRLPGNIHDCKWDGEKVVVDEAMKTQRETNKTRENKIQVEMQKITRGKAIQNLIDSGEIEP